MLRSRRKWHQSNRNNWEHDTPASSTVMGTTQRTTVSIPMETPQQNGIQQHHQSGRLQPSTLHHLWRSRRNFSSTRPWSTAPFTARQRHTPTMTRLSDCIDFNAMSECHDGAELRPRAPPLQVPPVSWSYRGFFIDITCPRPLSINSFFSHHWLIGSLFNIYQAHF